MSVSEVVRERDKLNAKYTALSKEVGKLKTAGTKREKDLVHAKVKLGALRSANIDLKSANKELEETAVEHRESFSHEVSLVYSVLSSVLADLGASVASIGDSDHEIVFFAWLKDELASFPNIVRTRSCYVARFTAEAAVGLLEQSGCSHTAALASNELAIDEGPTTLSLTRIKRVLRSTG